MEALSRRLGEFNRSAQQVNPIPRVSVQVCSKEIGDDKQRKIKDHRDTLTSLPNYRTGMEYS
jgi:hypothetical protein